MSAPTQSAISICRTTPSQAMHPWATLSAWHSDATNPLDKVYSRQCTTLGCTRREYLATSLQHTNQLRVLPDGKRRSSLGITTADYVVRTFSKRSVSAYCYFYLIGKEIQVLIGICPSIIQSKHLGYYGLTTALKINTALCNDINGILYTTTRIIQA